MNESPGTGIGKTLLLTTGRERRTGKSKQKSKTTLIHKGRDVHNRGKIRQVTKQGSMLMIQPIHFNRPRRTVSGSLHIESNILDTWTHSTKSTAELNHIMITWVPSMSKHDMLSTRHKQDFMTNHLRNNKVDQSKMQTITWDTKKGSIHIYAPATHQLPPQQPLMPELTPGCPPAVPLRKRPLLVPMALSRTSLPLEGWARSFFHYLINHPAIGVSPWLWKPPYVFSHGFSIVMEQMTGIGPLSRSRH